jgi:hypothetical protein
MPLKLAPIILDSSLPVGKEFAHARRAAAWDPTPSGFPEGIEDGIHAGFLDLMDERE